MLRSGNPTRWLPTFIGKPNAGKGTLATALSAAFNGYTEVSLGEICRAHKIQQSELWKKADAHMKTNVTTLWPTELMCQAIDLHLGDISAETSLVFDGLPRHPDQVEMTCEIARRFGYDAVRVFLIETTDEICRQRAKERQRSDDADFEKRLWEYHEHSLPGVKALLG